jgi:hypothetical protein
VSLHYEQPVEEATRKNSMKTGTELPLLGAMLCVCVEPLLRQLQYLRDALPTKKKEKAKLFTVLCTFYPLQC